MTLEHHDLRFQFEHALSNKRSAQHLRSHAAEIRMMNKEVIAASYEIRARARQFREERERVLARRSTTSSGYLQSVCRSSNR